MEVGVVEDVDEEVAVVVIVGFDNDEGTDDNEDGAWTLADALPGGVQCCTEDAVMTLGLLPSCCHGNGAFGDGP